jgi:SEC-C motif-containing protein
MRSRYSAFALGEVSYLLVTWHPDTRPPSLELDPDVRWTGLDVLATTRGAMLDDEGTVEFTAHYIVGRRAGALQEDSRFVRLDGQWHYLDGTVTG